MFYSRCIRRPLDLEALTYSPVYTVFVQTAFRTLLVCLQIEAVSQSLNKFLACVCLQTLYAKLLPHPPKKVHWSEILYLMN